MVTEPKMYRFFYMNVCARAVEEINKSNLHKKQTKNCRDGRELYFYFENLKTVN